MLHIVRSRPLTRFADLARLNERRLRRVFIISPWIGASGDSEFVPLVRTIVSAQQAKAKISVLTRRPDKSSHQSAVAAVSRLDQSEVLYLDSLHAKLYLLECNGLRVAIFGSPNFTTHGDQEWRELAVDVRSTGEADPAARFISDLFAFGRDLMSDRAAYFHKRLGRPVSDET